MFDLASHFAPLTQKALLIGGGVYTYPRHFLDKFPKATIDVVEIDSALDAIGKKYFDIESDRRITIFHQDGRSYLDHVKKKYDLIYMDAYSSHVSIPFQLTTREALLSAHSSLSENGIIIANIIAPLEGKNNLLKAMLKTYRNVFSNVTVFQADPTTETQRLQNVIIVGFKNQSIKPKLTSSDPYLNDLLKRIWTKEIDTNIPLLTDEFAPVEKYAAQIFI
jgi:spermidine synthase